MISIKYREYHYKQTLVEKLQEEVVSDQQDIPHYKQIQTIFADLLPKDPDMVEYNALKGRYHFRLQYKDIYIKLAKDREHASGIFEEGKMLERLQGKLPWNIPDPIVVFQQDIFPFSGFAYREIRGEVGHLTDSVEKEYWEKIIEQMCEIWHQIQQLHHDSEISNHLTEYDPHLSRLLNQLPHSQLKAEFNVEEYDNIMQFAELVEKVLSKPVKEKTFVHGDLWLGNIVFDEKKNVTGILDFSRCWYGDPLADIAKLAYANLEFGRDILQYYNEHYRSIDVEEALLRVVLHRGLFIFLALLENPLDDELQQKVEWLILNSLDDAKALN